MKKKYLVVGCGKTGVSCVRFLLKKGHDVEVFDTRTDAPGAEEISRISSAVNIFLGEWKSISLDDKDAVVVSPGVGRDVPLLRAAREKHIKIIGDIEVFYQHLNAPVVAITGSNGKSTVTAMLAAMAKEAGLKIAVGGNFGVPALDLLAKVDAYILEMSSFQLEYVQDFVADVSVILNISPDHLDRYQGLDEYRSAKEKIYHGKGIRVINKSEPDFLKFANDHALYFSSTQPEKANEYGLKEDAGECWLMRGQDKLMPAAEIPLQGEHNIVNVLAVFCLGTAIGLPVSAMRKAVLQFHGLPHRMELVTEKNSIRWIDDSKGTNVGASEAAVKGVDGAVVLIAGGVAKEEDFSLLVAVMEAKGRVAILMGRDASLLGKAFFGTVPVAYAADMVDAVNIAMGAAQPGDCVLLSPACASFDMYENYIERGDSFKKAVYQQLNKAEVFA